MSRSAVRMNMSGRAMPRNCSPLRQRASIFSRPSSNDVVEQIDGLVLSGLAVVVGQARGDRRYVGVTPIFGHLEGGQRHAQIGRRIDQRQFAQQAAAHDPFVRPERFKSRLDSQAARSPRGLWWRAAP